MNISKRKLESYRRAEIVAQASRHLMTVGCGHESKTATDLWSGAVMDWMTVTGKLKYAAPKRRGRRHW